MADLSLVLQGREDVRPAEELAFLVGGVAPDPFEQVFEPIIIVFSRRTPPRAKTVSKVSNRVSAAV